MAAGRVVRAGVGPLPALQGFGCDGSGQLARQGGLIQSRTTPSPTLGKLIRRRTGYDAPFGLHGRTYHRDYCPVIKRPQKRRDWIQMPPERGRSNDPVLAEIGEGGWASTAGNPVHPTSPRLQRKHPPYCTNRIARRVDHCDSHVQPPIDVRPVRLIRRRAVAVGGSCSRCRTSGQSLSRSATVRGTSPTPSIALMRGPQQPGVTEIARTGVYPTRLGEPVRPHSG
jgi:hypothetical protein